MEYIAYGGCEFSLFLPPKRDRRRSDPKVRLSIGQVVAAKVLAKGRSRVRRPTWLTRPRTRVTVSKAAAASSGG
ncbi:Protein of unknown function [Gryllus bimaculatus]|nr:Protein of unknown function [Gryllus bimaculatus]